MVTFFNQSCKKFTPSRKPVDDANSSGLTRSSSLTWISIVCFSVQWLSCQPTTKFFDRLESIRKLSAQYYSYSKSTLLPFCDYILIKASLASSMTCTLPFSFPVTVSMLLSMST